jgi:replicative DNA helicase
LNLPPHNLEAEAGVLGCLLWDGADCYSEAVSMGLKAEWFHDLRHATVFKAVRELESSGTPATVHAVKHRLNGALQDVGGLDYLLALANDSTPSPAILPMHMEGCRSAFLNRKAAAIAAKAIELAHGTAEGEEVLSSMVKQGSEALDSVTLKESRQGKELSRCLTDNLEKKKTLADSGMRSGLPTGLNRLDEMTDGLQFGEQFIIGARPGAGKTAMGITFVAEISLRQAVPTLVISCEMSTEALMTRLCSVYTGVSLSALRYGRYTEDDMKKIMSFNMKLASSPLYIFDALRGVTGNEVAAVIRQHARRSGVKFVLIDYLQKVRPDGRSEKRTYEVAEVSGALRAAAVSNNVAMVTLAQVNRDSDKGTEVRLPRACDLADSGQIERDADSIGLIHRDKKEPTKAMLLIAKQRDGADGMMDLYYNGPLTRFENADTTPRNED